MAKKSSSRINRRAIPGATLIPKDGYYKIRKIGITGERVKKDPAFHNTRLNAKEFGYLSKWAKLIRKTLLRETNIKQPAYLLQSALRKVIETDQHNFYGSRSLSNSDMGSLVDYNFNEDIPLQEVFTVPVALEYKETGKAVHVVIPGFLASEGFNAPPDITHARIYGITATFDITTMLVMTSRKESSFIPMKAVTVKGTKLSMTTDAGSNQLCVVALGINWYKQEGKRKVFLRSIIPGPLVILNAWRTDMNGRRL